MLTYFVHYLLFYYSCLISFSHFANQFKCILSKGDGQLIYRTYDNACIFINYKILENCNLKKNSFK